MVRTSAIRSFSLLCGIMLASNLQADLTTTNLYCLNIGNALSVIGPPDPIPITHDGLAGDKSFSPALWTCVSNNAAGAVLTIETTTGMVHSTLPLIKRDVRLDLGLQSADAGSGWATTVATDVTDVDGLPADDVATVVAESTAPGNCVVALTLTFITGDLGTLVPGLYCTTVNTTIAAK